MSDSSKRQKSDHVAMEDTTMTDAHSSHPNPQDTHMEDTAMTDAYPSNIQSDLYDVMQSIKKVEREIVDVNEELKDVAREQTHVDDLLNKPFKEWTEDEKEKYGSMEQLRDKEIRLLDEKKQLRDEKIRLLDKEKQLRDEKIRLLDKEKQLRDKEIRLLDEKKQLQAGAQSSRSAASLPKTDAKSLMGPLDIQPTLGEENPTPFIGPENWVEDRVAEIEERMKNMANSGSRVSPMAFVRCTRGGKTRALKEVAVALKKKLPDAAIIYISFNNDTSIDESEKEDPLAALRRRIAFAASKETNKGFRVFVKSDFAETDLLSWLTVDEKPKPCPCVLLVDELNLLTMDSKFAGFVKTHFLDARDRYFVFSSHVVKAVQELSSFMERVSERRVLAPGLPVVVSLAQAKENLNWKDLSARKTLYYGCIPGILVEAKKSENTVPMKKGEAFDKWFARLKEIKNEEAVDREIKMLLETFITGDDSSVPQELKPLFDASDKLLVKWIPSHMFIALNRLLSKSVCSVRLNDYLNTICTLFKNFMESKEESGEGWEALFVIALLIRCLLGKVHDIDEILPIKDEEHNINKPLTLSFQDPLIGRGNYNAIKKVDELLEMIPESHENEFHIAIYYPTNAKFELYDVIVAVFTRRRGRALFGYQLKEGKGSPNKNALSSFKRSVLIRGAPHESATLDNKGWYRASRESIEYFFGYSGRFWTPMYWKKLTEGCDCESPGLLKRILVIMMTCVEQVC